MGLKVLVTRPVDPCGTDYLAERGYEVRFAPSWDEETLVREAADVSGMLVRNDRITKRIMDAGPNLRVIVHADDENLPPFLRRFADDFMDMLDLGAGGIGDHGAALCKSVILRPGDAVGPDDHAVSF